MKHAEDEWLHVAVAVVRNPDGHILIAKRPEHLHQGGLWEFPGGKLEPGEGIEQALIREIQEEIGITVRPERPLIEIRHDYGDKKVRLDVWLSGIDAEQAQQSAQCERGREGQLIRWVSPDTLSTYPFPDANKPILSALSLPSSYLITPEVHNKKRFLDAVDNALQQGIRLIQLRDNSLTEREYIELARIVGTKCQQAGGQLLIKKAHRYLEVETADGIHLTSAELKVFSEPDSSARLGQLRESKLLAASCHNLEEIHLAEQLGLDFVTLSPVLKTQSHPHTSPLGWAHFQQCVQQAKIPVYALGGLQSDQMQDAWLHGAQGIAAIRGLWPLNRN